MYVVIAGINSTSKRLVNRLEGSHDVVAIDSDEDKCDRLYSSSGATVINKSPSTITSLEDAGVSKADVLIATQKKDSQNMVVCSLAKKFGVPKVVTRVEDDEYIDAFQLIDAEPVGHNDIMVSEFLSAVEHPSLVKLANLQNDLQIVKASVDQAHIEDKNPGEIYQIKDFPEEFRISTVIRDGEVLEQDEITLETGDSLIMIGPENSKEKLDSFFQNR